MYQAGRIRSHLLRSPKQKCSHCITSVHHALPRTHRTYVGIGSMHLEDGEQELPRFPNSTPGGLTPGPVDPQGWPPFFLLPLTGTIFSQPVNPLQSPQHLRLEGNHSPLFLLSLNPNSLFPQRDDIHLLRHRWTRQWMRISPLSWRRNRRTLRKERQQTGSPAWSLNVWMLSARTQILLRRQEPITSQLTPGVRLRVTQRICLIFSKNLPKRLAYWMTLFLKFNGHGRDQNIYSRPTMSSSLNPKDSDS